MYYQGCTELCKFYKDVEDIPLKTSEPKPEEILNKHMNRLPPEYVNYIPKRERDRYQFTLEAMQEYAEVYHKEKLREELINYDRYICRLDTRTSEHSVDEYLKQKQ
jgi:hypothetical protein